MKYFITDLVTGTHGKSIRVASYNIADVLEISNIDNIREEVKSYMEKIIGENFKAIDLDNRLSYKTV